MSTRTLHFPPNKISARQLDRESCHKGIEIPEMKMEVLGFIYDWMITNKGFRFDIQIKLIKPTKRTLNITSYNSFKMDLKRLCTTIHLKSMRLFFLPSDKVGKL